MDERFSDQARADQRRVQAGELPAASAWSLRDAVASDLMALAFELLAFEQNGNVEESVLRPLRAGVERMERKLKLAADAEADPSLVRDMSLVGERQAAVQRGELPAFDLVQLGDALRQDLAALGAYVSIIGAAGQEEAAGRMKALLRLVNDKVSAAFEEGWRRRNSERG